MKRWLIVLSLISTLTCSQIYKSEVLDISTNESLMISKTNRLNFHMSIVVDGNNASYDDYVKIGSLGKSVPCGDYSGVIVIRAEYLSD